jgi:hypothetical protein
VVTSPVMMRAPLLSWLLHLEGWKTTRILLDYGLRIETRAVCESGLGAWTILMSACEGDDDIRDPSDQATRNDWLKPIRFLSERGQTSMPLVQKI